MLLRKTRRVGIFRPLITENTAGKRDKNIDLILTHFALDIDYNDTYVFTTRQVSDLLAHGHYDQFLDEIIKKYKKLEAECDFILCIGSDLVGDNSAFEFDINAEIAHNLGCPVLVLGSADGNDVKDTVDPVKLALDRFEARGCQILGAIVNRSQPEMCAQLLDCLKARLTQKDIFMSVIPINRVLNSPTLKEIAEHLNADVLYGHDRLERQAYRYMVIAMQVHNYLDRLTDNALLITPADRGEIILSALQAHQSRNYPLIAGILLTAGIELAPSIKTLLDGLPSVLPILSVDTETYETAAGIGNIRSYITADNQAKIASSQKLFEEYVDTEMLDKQISTVRVRGLTPKMFLYNLVQQAKADKQHIVLPEGREERILKAVEILVEQEIVDVTLLGNENEIKATINRLGLRIDPDKISMVNPQQSPQFEEYTQTLFDLRRHKGLALEHAKDLITDGSYFGSMMVYKGHADGMVSGAVHTTLHTIKPALQFIRTKPGISVVSSVFFMCLDDRVIIYGDCAVNPNPTAEDPWPKLLSPRLKPGQAFGLEAKVAMLSYSSGDFRRGRRC